MKDILVLFAHLLVTFAKLIGPGGAKSVVAENLILKQQLLVINRSRQRAPNLTTANRFVFGLATLFLLPNRITKVSVIIRPSTLLKFHQYLARISHQAAPNSDVALIHKAIYRNEELHGVIESHAYPGPGWFSHTCAWPSLDP